MFHFQAVKFGEHKISDEYMTKYLVNYDKLMECSQGVYGKLNMSKLKIDVKIYGSSNMREYMERHIKILKIIKEKEENDSIKDIINNMLLDAYQFVYLLTFE